MSHHWRESLHPRDHDGKFADGLDVRVATRDHTGSLVHHGGGEDPTLPADPYAALTDVTHSFDRMQALEAVHAGRGTAGQRKAITDALRRRDGVQLSGTVDGLTQYEYRADILAPESSWGNSDDDARAFATKIHGLLAEGDAPPEWFAELAKSLDAALARNRYQRSPRGMPGGPKFTDNAEGRAWAKEHMPTDLTPGQAKAVRDYTGGLDGPSSTYINKALRFGQVEPEWADQVHTAIGELDAAIAAHVLPEPLLLHRGEDEGGIRSLGIDPDNPESLASLTGRVIHDDAYWSTSIGRKPAGAGIAGGHVTWLIRAPAGEHGLAVHNSAWESEGEVLLPRGTKRVVHAAYREPGNDGYRIFVEVEIVPDDWTYPTGWRPDPQHGDAWKDYLK